MKLNTSGWTPFVTRKLMHLSSCTWHRIYWKMYIIILVVYIIVYCLYLRLITFYPVPLNSYIAALLNPVSCSFYNLLTSVHDPESLACIPCIYFSCMAYSAIWEMLAADSSKTLLLLYHTTWSQSHLTHHHENLTPHKSVNINYREAIQEDEEGLLEGSVAEIIQRAKRKRQSERRGNTRLGMMRHLYLVVDNSDCMSNQDLKPTRQLCTIKVIN